MKKTYIFLFFCFLIPWFIFSAEPKTPWADKGTLIISYHTDHQGNRLDRIRFWLINDKKEQTLYPKKEEFTTKNHTGNEKTIVISHLPAGRYTLKFLTPNTDHFFNPVPPRSFVMHPGEILKIEQDIQPVTKAANHKRQIEKREEIAMLDWGSKLSSSRSFLGIIITNYADPFLGPFVPPGLPPPGFPINFTSFSLKTNQPRAEWKLMHAGRIIYANIGPVSNLPIPTGRNYYIITQMIPGYTPYTSPKGLFNADQGRPIQAEIFYQRDTGYLNFKGVWMSSQPLTITVNSPDYFQEPISTQLEPSKGMISWQSTPLPTGEYTISYSTSSSGMQQQRFTILKDQHTLLSPQLVMRGSLEIAADTSDAIFTLKKQNGTLIGQGRGQQYTFKDLEPGYYTIQFSSSDPEIFNAPPSQQVLINSNQPNKLSVSYRKSGRVIVSSNVDQFRIRIQPANTQQKPFQETISSRSRNFYLPEGVYSIFYEPLSSQGKSLGPVQVEIKAFSTQNVYLPYDLKDASSIAKDNPPPKETSQDVKTGVWVKTNLNESRFRIQPSDPLLGPPTRDFKGKSVFIPLESPGEYTLIFESVPNYQTPDAISIFNEVGKQATIDVQYQMGDAFVNVPAGDAIVGDPFTDSSINERPAKTVYIPEFSIGTYEVTNAQFARWLNQAWQQKKIAWHPTLPGHLVDQEGFLICRTLEGDHSSQILTRKDSSDFTFTSIPGKENYPVIQVSWYGANAYCRDQGYRLPKENEWEKAAGMSLPSGHKELKRYKFGFSSDIIDRTFANYRVSSFNRDATQVLTTPVGFYNGINTLPLIMDDRTALVTHDAKSPAGAYDMSGNVWEWVASWDDTDPSDTKKVAKGGCYDSFADGVRVSERLALLPDYADMYTGFRAAK